MYVTLKRNGEDQLCPFFTEENLYYLSKLKIDYQQLENDLNYITFTTNLSNHLMIILEFKFTIIFICLFYTFYYFLEWFIISYSSIKIVFYIFIVFILVAFFKSIYLNIMSITTVRKIVNAKLKKSSETRQYTIQVNYFFECEVTNQQKIEYKDFNSNKPILGNTNLSRKEFNYYTYYIPLKFINYKDNSIQCNNLKLKIYPEIEQLFLDTIWKIEEIYNDLKSKELLRNIYNSSVFIIIIFASEMILLYYNRIKTQISENLTTVLVSSLCLSVLFILIISIRNSFKSEWEFRQILFNLSTKNLIVKSEYSMHLIGIFINYSDEDSISD
jgi:hypothetical protein